MAHGTWHNEALPLLCILDLDRGITINELTSPFLFGMYHTLYFNQIGNGFFNIDKQDQQRRSQKKQRKRRKRPALRRLAYAL